MASFAAFLEVKGQRYPLLSYTLSIHQETDSLGRPASPTLGGIIDCVLSAPGSDKSFLHQWMFSPTLQEDGRIILMSVAPESTLKTISFFNAYCVSLQTNFVPGAGEGGSLQMSIRISPQRVAVGAIVHDNNWPVASHGTGQSFVRQEPQSQPKPKPKPGIVMGPPPVGLPRVPRIPPTTSPHPPKSRLAGPYRPRKPSNPIPHPVLVFLWALLYSHDAGMANEWVNQLATEDEARWQVLEKKRKELQKQGKVLPTHEYEKWLALDTERFPYGRDGNGKRPRVIGNAGNEKGKVREEKVAEITGGTVAKDEKGQDILLTVEGGSTGLDVIGPNGEYIQVGGAAKGGKNLSKFANQLSKLRKAAKRDGVEAHVYLEEGTPQEVIDMAIRQLGAGNVHIFTLP